MSKYESVREIAEEHGVSINEVSGLLFHSKLYKDIEKAETFDELKDCMLRWHNYTEDRLKEKD